MVKLLVTSTGKSLMDSLTTIFYGGRVGQGNIKTNAYYIYLKNEYFNR